MSYEMLYPAIKERKTHLKERVSKSTYGQLAKELDVSKGALWKFINTDYIPITQALRRKLGLPIIVYQYKDPTTGRFMKKE